MKNVLKTSLLVTMIALQSNVAFGYGIAAKGIFKHGHAVHEAITRKAAIDAKYLSELDTYQMKHLIEGVRFNDDPEGHLASGDVLGFASKFLGDNKGVKNATEASHFGSYQFLHAMGKSGTSAHDIKKNMMLYAYHCWISATDNDSFAKTKLNYLNVLEKNKLNSPDSAYSQDELIMKEAVQMFPREIIFFNTDNQNSFQNRALGSLIHMIQDSYSKGHVVRVGWEDGSNIGDIRYFQDYKQQDSHQHEAYDEPKSGKLNEKTLFEIPGTKMAYLRTKQVLEMATNKCPWLSYDLKQSPSCSESVYSFLNKSVFAIDENTNLDARKTRTHKELIPVPKPTQDPYNQYGG